MTSSTGGGEICVQPPPSQSSKDDEKEDILDVAIKAHQDALEDLVNANSIFTLAVFIGLSVVQPGDKSLSDNKECNADPRTYDKLIAHEVLSFAFYLLSSLVAKALKAHLYTYSLEKTDINTMHSMVIRASMLSLSTCGSILGSVFLTLSLVELIEIRLGKMSCRDTYTLHASEALIALVVLALSIYMLCMTDAIFNSVKKLEKTSSNP